MTHSEAIRIIENWLLVPIQLSEILPALAVLRYSIEFERYVERVAQADFKTPEDITKEVDTYILRAGVQNSPLTQEQPKETNHLERQRQKDKLNALRKAKRHEPRGDDSWCALTKRCRECRAQMKGKEVSEVQPIGWILFVVLLFSIFPLCFIPLLVFREKRIKYICPNCRRVE